MTTERPKIQAYLEPELYAKLQEWKAQQGIEKDSAAINQILLEYFDICQSIDNYLDARIEEYFKQRDLELADKLARIIARIEIVEKICEPIEGLAELSKPLPNKPLPNELTQTELSKRFGIHKSTLSHRKEGAGFEEWSRVYDPEARAWRYDREKKVFIPL